MHNQAPSLFLAEYLPDGFAAVLRDDPLRRAAVEKEVAWAAAGRGQPIELSLDPVTAFALANAVQVSLCRFAPPSASREPLERIVSGLEAAIRKQCPELAALLAFGRRKATPAAGDSGPPRQPLFAEDLAS